MVLMARKPAPKPEPKPQSRRDDLVLMREHLMRAMLDADVSVVAQIVGQLRQVIKELDELPEAKAESALEQAAARRKARRSNLKAV
jgi:hypothetical protein